MAALLPNLALMTFILLLKDAFKSFHQSSFDSITPPPIIKISGSNMFLMLIINIESNKSTWGERLLECVYMCDWISYYLAILNKKDPGEIDFIHHLKNKMSEV